MAALHANNVGFTPTLGGTTDWTFSAIIIGYQTPAQANLFNGEVYTILSQSNDRSQWEYTSGAYNSATGVFARTTVLYNSSGTGSAPGQSGAGSKINFSSAPNCYVIAMEQDLLNSKRVVVPLLSGVAQTYTPGKGCKAIEVEVQGGGGGGGGGGTTPAGSAGSAGGTSNFIGTSTNISCGGGSPGGPQGNAYSVGGSATGGDLNIAGQYGMAAYGAGATSQIYQGSTGGSSRLGFGGQGGWAAQAGSAGVGYGGGGGGGGVQANIGCGGAGGAGGGWSRKFIQTPEASYTYTVGAAGSGGGPGGGTNASSGAPGSIGIIFITEFY